MPSLYIDRRCTALKLSGEVLICYENDERIGTIPLAPIDRLYIKGDVSLPASLLAKLGEKGIGVVFLSGRKNTPAMFLPRPHNDAERRLLQYHFALQPEFINHIAQCFVIEKLLKQKQWLYTLPQFNKRLEFEDLLQKLAMPQSVASLRGIEGRAAVLHFETIATQLPAELGFEGRNRRPPKDPFNAMLSLTATLLQSEATLAIYGAGLDPYIGFLHSLDYGRESLSCDMIEPIRPLATHWLIELFQQSILKNDYFSMTAEGCFLGKEGRVIFYTEFEKQAEQWRKMLNSQCYQLVRLFKECKTANTLPTVFNQFNLGDMVENWEQTE